MADTTATPATLQTQALAYMAAWCRRDFWTIAQIGLDLDRSGATAQQVAESFSLAAAALLTDVCQGHSTEAAQWAEDAALADAGRQARAALAAAR